MCYCCFLLFWLGLVVHSFSSGVGGANGRGDVVCECECDWMSEWVSESESECVRVRVRVSEWLSEVEYVLGFAGVYSPQVHELLLTVVQLVIKGFKRKPSLPTSFEGNWDLSFSVKSLSYHYTKWTCVAVYIDTLIFPSLSLSSWVCIHGVLCRFSVDHHPCVDQAWSKLKAAVTAIHLKQPVNSSLEELYKVVSFRLEMLTGSRLAKTYAAII